MRINLLKQSIKQASIIIAGVTVLSQLTGLFRESLIASYYGTSEGLDILILALAMPLMISNILLVTIPSSGIPNLQGANKGNTISKNKTTGFLKVNTVIIFVLTALLFISLPYLKNKLVPGLSQDGADNLVKYGRIFCLIIPFRAYEGVFRSLLHVRHHFFFPALTNLAMNIIFITILIILYPKYMTGAYIIAMISSVFIQMLIVSIPWFFILQKSLQKVSDDIFDTSLYAKFFFGVILIEVLGMIIAPFDRYLAGGYLESGFVSALNYADIIQSVPFRILALSLGTAIFPTLSENSTAGDVTSVSKLYYKSLAFCLFLIIPISIYSYLYRNEIVSLLFERGRFDSRSTAITVDILRYYLLGMIFPSIFHVQAKVLISLKKWKALGGAKLLGLSLKVLIGLFMIKVNWAVAIAVGTISMYAFCFILLEIYLKVKVGLSYSSESLKLLAKSLLGSFIVSVVVITCWALLEDSINYLAAIFITGICGAIIGVAYDLKYNITGINLAKYMKING